MNAVITIILLGIPFALWGIVSTTFVWLGVTAENDFIYFGGYFGVAMGYFLACKISYRKGRLDQKRMAEPGTGGNAI